MYLMHPQVELDPLLLILTLATLVIGFFTCSLLDRLRSTRSAPTCYAKRAGVGMSVDRKTSVAIDQAVAPKY